MYLNNYLNMKVLFIGGSGNISSAVSKLAIEKGIDLFHLNRGNNTNLNNVKTLIGDINQTEKVTELLKNHTWDVVVNWIAFTPVDIERDVKLFKGKTKQYIFISSASAYQKPPLNSVITESTPLKNPYWDYSRNKIACEELLLKMYRDIDFPVTIVRPSHTYNTVIPISLGGWTEYTTVDRMKRGLPILVHGDGTSLWTITHADDFAIGFVGLMNHTKAIGEAYHITSDEAMSWNYIYEVVGNAIGVKPKLVHLSSEMIVEFAKNQYGADVSGTLLGDKMHSAVFDNSKIKRIIPEFICTIPFHSGIKRTIKWFEEQSSRMVINDVNNRLFDHIIKEYKL
jgi:nucleoside-diphosphate-sugar epimerase